MRYPTPQWCEICSCQCQRPIWSVPSGSWFAPQATRCRRPRDHMKFFAALNFTDLQDAVHICACCFDGFWKSAMSLSKSLLMNTFVFVGGKVPIFCDPTIMLSKAWLLHLRWTESWCLRVWTPIRQRNCERKRCRWCRPDQLRANDKDKNLSWYKNYFCGCLSKHFNKAGKLHECFAARIRCLHHPGQIWWPQTLHWFYEAVPSWQSFVGTRPPL